MVLIWRNRIHASRVWDSFQSLVWCTRRFVIYGLDKWHLLRLTRWSAVDFWPWLVSRLQRHLRLLLDLFVNLFNDFSYFVVLLERWDLRIFVFFAIRWASFLQYATQLGLFWASALTFTMALALALALTLTLTIAPMLLRVAVDLFRKWARKLYAAFLLFTHFINLLYFFEILSVF